MGKILAFLVHDRPHPLELLGGALQKLSVETLTVRTCEELERLIAQKQPHLIFTDTSLSDGTWMDVIKLAQKSTVPVNVIVVGLNNDRRLYISALERGAFDLVMPPFKRRGLDFVVRIAGNDAHLRRRAQAQAGAC